jgi:hypothetical protein
MGVMKRSLMEQEEQQWSGGSSASDAELSSMSLKWILSEKTCDSAGSVALQKRSRRSLMDKSKTGDRATGIYKELLDAFPHVRKWMKEECRDVAATRALWISAIADLPIDAVAKAQDKIIKGDEPLVPKFKNTAFLPTHLANLAKSIAAEEQRKQDNEELLKRPPPDSSPPPATSAVELFEERERIDARVREEIPDAEPDVQERRIQKEFEQLVDKAFHYD